MTLSETFGEYSQFFPSAFLILFNSFKRKPVKIYAAHMFMLKKKKIV